MKMMMWSRQTLSDIGEVMSREETQNSGVKRRRSMWQTGAIVISMVLLCGVTTLLAVQLYKQQTFNLQLMAKNNEQLEIENDQVKTTLHNLTREYEQLKLLSNDLQKTSATLEAENEQLKLLSNDLQKTSATLEAENEQLKLLSNDLQKTSATLEAENEQLKLLSNDLQKTSATLEAENEQLKLLSNDLQKTSATLEAENEQLRSILFSDKLSFLWKYCNKDTLQCSRCPPGWVEHDSRCFFLSREPENWETARDKCLAIESDLAVVLNAEDQSVLTNMTLQFQQQHPEENLLSAWIGLQDMAHEGIFKWVNGNRLSKDVTFWKPLEPNNALATWDKTQAGQDCVAIDEPKHPGEYGLNNWDDIVCGGKRHYLCETPALCLS